MSYSIETRLYRFEIVREAAEKHHITDLIARSDPGHFLQLVQLLATELLFDGCLNQLQQVGLQTLAPKLRTGPNRPEHLRRAVDLHCLINTTQTIL